MKKVLLVAGFVATMFIANAQEKASASYPFSAGTISAGGNIGIQFGGGTTKAGGTTVDKPSTFAFAILPNVQYFLTDNISVGVEIGIKTSSSTTKATDATNTTPATQEIVTSSTTFSFSPYARYYYFLDEGKVAFFGQGSIGISTQSGSSKTGGTTTDAPSVFTFGVGVSPGIIFFPTKKIGIEATLGNILAVQSVTETTKAVGGDIVDSSTGFDFLTVNTFALKLGFNYYFGN